MAKKRPKLFQTGELGGRGGSEGLGEHVGQPDRYEVRPTAAEVLKVAKYKMRGMQKGVPPGHLRQTGGDPMKTTDEKIAAVVEAAEIIPSQMVIRTIVDLTTAVQSIDTALAKREEILIANMSDVVIWINTIPQVAANIGLPLAASAPAGSMNGGVFTAQIDENVRFYAIAAGGANNMLVVIETARD